MGSWVVFLLDLAIPGGLHSGLERVLQDAVRPFLFFMGVSAHSNFFLFFSFSSFRG